MTDFFYAEFQRNFSSREGGTVVQGSLVLF